MLCGRVWGMSYPVKTIADYFLSLAEPETGDAMTHLRLQKLAYYAQGWHLALTGRPLFPNELEAWPHGPVSPALFSRFKGYKFDIIPRTEIKADLSKIDSATRKILDDVWRVYGQFTAKRLEEMTHSERPWIEARAGLAPEEKSNNKISQNVMREYFSSVLANA